MKRQEVYESIFSARALLIAGILIMPSLLFNPVTEYRCLQFVLYWLLVVLSGKKSNPLLTLLVIAIIAGFNLIIPHGRVLLSIGPVKITTGALRAGIHRAVTFEALVMISKVSIRRDLKIPGAFGELLAESLRIFSFMMSRKVQFTGRNIFTEIDNLLFELSAADIPATVTHEQRTKFVGFVVIAVVVLASWLLCVSSLLY